MDKLREKLKSRRKVFKQRTDSNNYDKDERSHRQHETYNAAKRSQSHQESYSSFKRSQTHQDNYDSVKHSKSHHENYDSVKRSESHQENYDSVKRSKIHQENYDSVMRSKIHQENYDSAKRSKSHHENYDTVKRSESHQENYDSAKLSQLYQKNYDSAKRSQSHSTLYSSKKRASEYCKTHQDDVQQNKSGKERQLNKFFSEIQFGPDFICVCCQRRLMRRGVEKLSDHLIEYLLGKNIYSYITLRPNWIYLESYWVCLTCKNDLSKGAMPVLCATKNKMELPDLPDCFRELTDIEAQFIKKIIPFLKVRRFPKTRMKVIL